MAEGQEWHGIEEESKRFMHSLGLDSIPFHIGEPENPDDPSVEQKKLKSRNTSIKEGASYSVMDGLGHRYITPYALAVGANNTEVGILSSLPPLVGSISQLTTIRLMERYPRKRIIFLVALFQAIMWLIVLAVGSTYFIFGLKSQVTPLLLILAYTVLFVFGSMIAPAWTSWMRDLVPKKCGSYFGYRNRVIGFILLVTMLLGGFVLDYFKETKVFMGFIILFTLAFIFRVVSSTLFLKQYEPEFVLHHKRVHFKDVMHILMTENYGKFILFQMAFSFTVAIASPFFAVYMLKDLGFTYTEYIIIAITSASMSMVFMPVWGKFADKYGNLRVLKIAGFGIPLIPIAYLPVPTILSGNPDMVMPYLIIIEMFSGFVWAGFNLASANFIFDSVNKENTPAYTAYFNIFNNVGMFIGALLGGLLSVVSYSLFGFTGFLFVFLVSGVARLACMLLIRQVREERPVRPFDLEEVKDVFHRLTPHQIIRIIR